METDEQQDGNLENTNDELVFEEESIEPDWKAEALKYKSMASRYKEKLAEKPEKPTLQEKTIPAVNVNEEALELRLDGYSKEETEYIMRNGGRKTLEDKSSLVSLALQAKREQEKAEKAASQTGEGSQLTAIERKYTPEKLKSMSVEELKKILPHA